MRSLGSRLTPTRIHILVFMSTTTQFAEKSPGNTGRGSVWLGLAAALLGPVLYVAQLKAGRLVVPWYLPLLGTLGCLLVLASLGHVKSLGRILLVGVLGFLAFGEWFFLLSVSKLPSYSGPVAVGKPFPAFATTWADGKPFTEASLPGDLNTIMVFF